MTVFPFRVDFQYRILTPVSLQLQCSKFGHILLSSVSLFQSPLLSERPEKSFLKVDFLDANYFFFITIPPLC